MKTSKLRVTGLCARNSPWPVNSPHKGPVTRIMFPFDDVIVTLAGYNWYTKTKQSKPYPGIHAVLCTMCGMDKVALLLSSRSCQVTLDISGAPLIFNGAPGNIQVNLERYVVTRYWCQTILQPCMWVPCLVFITIKKLQTRAAVSSGIWICIWHICRDIWTDPFGISILMIGERFQNSFHRVTSVLCLKVDKHQRSVEHMFSVITPPCSNGWHDVSKNASRPESNAGAWLLQRVGIYFRSDDDIKCLII